MSNLRLKVNIGDVSFEAEGEKSDVLEQLREFEQNKLKLFKDISAKPATHFITTEHELPTNSGTILKGKTASLLDIAIKQNGKHPQKVWVAIFSYYLNLEGKQIFTRDDLIQKYEESKLKTEQNMKNLTNSIEGAAKENWISILNKKELALTEDGESMVVKVLQGKNKVDEKSS